MALTFPDIAAALRHGHDMLIDVRSPAEFAADRMPGAVSLPVFSDEERARVGTIYVQDSPFAARKIGAAILARNTAHHLETALAGMPGGWRPLIYCWRGGQRSGGFATILTQIGWRCETVAGGYKSWRRLVQGFLYGPTLPHRLVLIDGNTGTAKTAILGHLSALGVQVLDLEGLARHRGSLLGAMAGGQPAQTGFESELAEALARMDPARPVVVEAESSQIGRITLPPALWSAMRGAGRIVVSAPVEERAAYLAHAYADLTSRPEELAARLQTLRQFHGHAVVDRWDAQVAAGDWPALARALIEEHYDPAYAKWRRLHPPRVLDEIALDRLTPGALAEAARVLAARIS